MGTTRDGGKVRGRWTKGGQRSRIFFRMRVGWERRDARGRGWGRTFFLMYFFSSAIVPFSTRPVAAASSSRRAELLFGGI